MKRIFFFWVFSFCSVCAFSQTWQELNDSIIYYTNHGLYSQGVLVGEKAVTAAKKEFNENHPNYATSLNKLALLYESMGQFEKAEPLYLQAKEIRNKVLGENHPDYAQSLNNLAGLYESMGQYEKAEPLYLQAKEIRKKVLGENHPAYASSLNNLALLYASMGQYEKAEPLYLQAKEIRKKVFGENHPAYATSLNNLAVLYKSMGQYEKAEPLLLQAKEISKKVPGENHPDYALSLNNLALLYYSMGQYEKAEPLYLQAKEIWKKVLGENHPAYATSLNNLAVLYESMGQYEKAEPLYLQAKEIRKKVLGENHPAYAQSLNDLASLYESMGQYEKAEPLYLQAKEIRKKVPGENHPDYAQSLNNLAGLYESMGQYEKAEPLYLQAKEIRKKVPGENHPDYATSLNNLAALYYSMGQYEKAEPLYLQAKEIWKKMLGENHPDYATSLNNLALLYASMGQYEKAEPLILENNKIVLQNMLNTFTILSEKEKGNYLNSNISLLETNNSLIYNYKKASPAIMRNNFNSQLILKSITLTDTKTILASLLQSSDTVLKRLLKEWQITKNILAKQYSLPIAKRREDLKEMETQTEDLEKKLNRLSAEFRNQQRAIRISMEDVQESLEEEEAAIEFVRFHLYNKTWTDSIIYAAYLLRKTDSVPVFIPLCEERQLQQLFDSAGNTPNIMVSSFYRGAEVGNTNSSASLGTALYNLIWQPLEPFIKGVNKVSYSPAGKLYSIAFQALPADSVTVLMDKYELQQYTSTRQVAFRNSENQATRPTSITLFGNASFTMDSLQLVKQKMTQPKKENVSTSIYLPPKRGNDHGAWVDLPGTAEEVKVIQQLFEQNRISSKTFVQTESSEENLKSLNGHSTQILHIATHGFFLPQPDKKKTERGFGEGNTYTLADDPLLRSGLILAGGNYAWSGKTPVEGVEDGIATAYEISQLNLSNTELVVLSACETALGDVKGSEGVFGLQRAFKMAGVKKLIVSLWQVPDKETAELMTSFYSYWMNGKSINDAFAQAQADMRKKYSPFYWAAFVLVE